MKKYVTVKIRLPVKLHNKLKKAADAKNISVADLMLEFVQEYLAEKLS